MTLEEVRKRLTDGTATAADYKAIVMTFGSPRCKKEPNNKELYINAKCDWNCGVRFLYVDGNKFHCAIYWLGEDTDGEFWIPMDEALRGTHVERVREDWSRGPSYHTCRVNKEVIRLMNEELLKYTSTEEIAKRKAKAEADAKSKRIEDRCGELFLNEEYEKNYKNNHSLTDCEKYWNGSRAVRQLIHTDEDKFLAMSDDELRAIVKKVYYNNHMNDYRFNRGWGADHHRPEIPYDLRY